MLLCQLRSDAFIVAASVAQLPLRNFSAQVLLIIHGCPLANSHAATRFFHPLMFPCLSIPPNLPEDVSFWTVLSGDDDHGVFVIADFSAGLVGKVFHDGFGRHVLEVERNFLIGEDFFRILNDEIRRHC